MKIQGKMLSYKKQYAQKLDKITKKSGNIDFHKDFCTQFGIGSLKC